MKMLHPLLLLIIIFTSEAHGGTVVINAVGDIMLAGRGSTSFSRDGYDYPFAATVAALKNGDLAIGNLEAPLAAGGAEFSSKRFRFRGDPKAAAALKRAGFTVLTLANNHMLDYGEQGLLETLHHLDTQGIKHSGAGKTLSAARREAFVTCNDRTIAFLSYSLTFPEEFYAGSSRAGTAPAYPPYYEKDIARAKAKADFVVVSFHWGQELATLPKQYQVLTARNAVNAGADLIIGHHPHVLQGIEQYKNALIFYSLGNFAFGSWSKSSDRSIIARITLDNGLTEAELIPLNVLNSDIHFQPAILQGKRGKAVIERLSTASKPMGTTIEERNGRYLVKLRPGKSSPGKVGVAHASAVRGN